jgi:signal transduction histidine kinase
MPLRLIARLGVNAAPAWVHHAAAVALALVSLALTEIFSGPLQGPFFFTTYPAVLLADLFGGLAPAVTALVILSAGFAYFLPPNRSFAILAGHDMGRMAAVVASALLVALLGAALRTAYRREAELRRTAEATSRALADAEARLRARTEDLERVKERREDVVRMLTHDMRSALSVATMQAQLLRRELHGDPGHERRLGAILTCSSRLSLMLADLADLVLVDAGLVRLRRARVDVVPYLRELRDRLEPLVPRHRLALTSSEDVVCSADPERLERILVNLVGNAAKYSPPGTTIVIEVAARGAGVTFTVLDEGPGIPPVERAQIFDRYYRGSATEETEGLGLGLYISRVLAEAHGGAIWVDGREGGGSAFRVRIPRESDSLREGAHARAG